MRGSIFFPPSAEGLNLFTLCASWANIRHTVRAGMAVHQALPAIPCLCVHIWGQIAGRTLQDCRPRCLATSFSLVWVYVCHSCRQVGLASKTNHCVCLPNTSEIFLFKTGNYVASVFTVKLWPCNSKKVSRIIILQIFSGLEMKNFSHMNVLCVHSTPANSGAIGLAIVALKAVKVLVMFLLLREFVLVSVLGDSRWV